MGDEWYGQAECLKSHVDPGWFHPVDKPDGKAKHNGTISQVYPDRMRAQLVCADCPVWKDCLRSNLDAEYGIFAGMDQNERGRLRQADIAALTHPTREVSTAGRIALYAYLRGHTLAEAAEMAELPAWKVNELFHRRVRVQRGALYGRASVGKDAA